MNIATLVVQCGALGLLAAVLWLLFQKGGSLLGTIVPLVDRHMATLTAIDKTLVNVGDELRRQGERISHLGDEVRMLKDRGVCPMLATREAGNRPTEPEAG